MSYEGCIIIDIRIEVLFLQSLVRFELFQVSQFLRIVIDGEKDALSPALPYLWSVNEGIFWC